MKLLLVFFVAICIAGAYCGPLELKPEDAEKIKECQNKNNITQEVVDEIRKQKSFSVSQDTKCFIQCLSEKRGLVDSEGKVAGTFKDDKEVQNCEKNISGTDKCDRAAQLVNCLLKGADFQHLVFV